MLFRLQEREKLGSAIAAGRHGGIGTKPGRNRPCWPGWTEKREGASRYGERLSLPRVLATNIPLMAAAAELDPPRFVEQFNLLKEASCKRPAGCARTVMLPQHNHMSEVYSINTADTRLTDEVLEFVKNGK